MSETKELKPKATVIAPVETVTTKLVQPEPVQPEIESGSLSVNTTPFKDRRPANWSINPKGEGIEAFNSLSGESFEGSMKEFNSKLRG
jgi:hypothetical protein